MAILSSLLLGASVGASILNMRQQVDTSARNAARAQVQGDLAVERAGVNVRQTVFSGEMERFQIREEAQEADRFRRMEFSQALGTQRARTASAGVIGGRTQRLIEAQSQAALTRERSRARFKEGMQLRSSEFNERTRVRAIETGAVDAQMQASAGVDRAETNAQSARTSFFADLVGAGRSGQTLFEQNQAAT